VIGLAALLCGCAESVDDELARTLQDRLDSRHGHYLQDRSHDPYSTGREALESLDPYGYALEARVEDDSVVLVEAIGVRAQRGGGLSYEQRSLAACLEVTVEPGEGGRDRGHVRTEPVDCPDGVEVRDTMWVEGSAQDLTTDLDGRSDSVPEPEPDRAVCHSGDDCTQGGG